MIFTTAEAVGGAARATTPALGVEMEVATRVATVVVVVEAGADDRGEAFWHLLKSPGIQAGAGYPTPSTGRTHACGCPVTPAAPTGMPRGELSLTLTLAQSLTLTLRISRHLPLNTPKVQLVQLLIFGAGGGELRIWKNMYSSRNYAGGTYVRFLVYVAISLAFWTASPI